MSLKASPAALGAASLLLGAATVLGFAPFGFSPLPILTLAVLFGLWRGAPSARAAAGLGFAFGLGVFGGGFSWIYVALATFGGMPAPLAALATLMLCAYLALFPAATGWLCARLAQRGTGERLALAAACWTIMEWLRSWFLSG
ncbi:MAG TPA: apolipoprotein N-acyltransferase, partial [Thermoanaerobaculia bacterium]|nr:apolipoprotein N-acyltransferase [Thermoanaerobaculia bacterium]